MTHLWLRAEQRENERRVCLTHDGASTLVNAGIQLSVEKSDARILDLSGYEAAGAKIVEENSWPGAPVDAIILGLKELPDSTEPLHHKHIMFGHAYKGQFSGKALLSRFKSGGGALYDLEYLLDENNRRIAAFGYWAGFAGAAVTVKAWIAQQKQSRCKAVDAYINKDALVDEIRLELADVSGPLPKAIIIGALGRVGAGVRDLCNSLNVQVTPWDIQDTCDGGPFPEVLEHDLFLNCIVATQGVPQFVPISAKSAPRRLSTIGDIACDPDSNYNPIPVYDRVTTWEEPVVRVNENPVLDVMAIDNLPSMLPMESSIDFANQLIPALLTVDSMEHGVWGRARQIFNEHITEDKLI